MQLIISGHGVVLTPAFKALVERKVAKLERLRPRILRARVSCGAQKHERRVRLTLAAKRRTFASHAVAGDLVSAVDDAIEALVRQVREDKGRRRSRVVRATPPVVAV